MTSEQLGARVFLSGALIRKVQAGQRVPNENLVTACEAIPELGCNGALLHLYRMLEDYFRTGAYPDHGTGRTLTFPASSWTTFTTSLKH